MQIYTAPKSAGRWKGLVILMKKWWRTESGLLSLEACISLTMFIFLMLFLYSYFIVFEARNEMAHVLLASTKSLSLDAYAPSRLDDTGTLTQFFFKIYGAVSGNRNQFASTLNWTSMGENEDGNVYADLHKQGNQGTSVLNEMIKERFLAYLADGDQEMAERILKRYHVRGGVSGLDFSESYLSDGNLYVVVKYTLEYDFQFFGLESLEMKQSACSKMWK